MQREFPFSVPVAEPAECRQLGVFLKSQRGWVKARTITERLGLDERRIRLIAEHSNGAIVSGPGCPGYKHRDNCTADDLAEVVSKLTSQANRMLKRAKRLRSA